MIPVIFNLIGDSLLIIHHPEGIDLSINDLDHHIVNYYPKKIRLTVSDTSDEMSILKGGLQYIIKYKPDIICSSIPRTLLSVLGYQAQDGVHRFTPKKIRVKLMCNWMTNEEICRCWSKMSKGNCEWNNIKIVYDDIDIDYYVIINKPLPGEKYLPSKTMVFRMEPDTSTSLVWKDWYESEKEFMYFFNLENYRNNTEWHLGLDYNQLRNTQIVKTKTISSVVSSLYTMEGHKKRIDFLTYCQSHGLEIDIYGRDNKFQFKGYKGSLPYHNKNTGILPYKYTFIAENCSIPNYFTEKIIDAILGECLCFYWGCSNIDSFIDPRAFIKLELNNFESSLSILNSAINNREWERRLPYIKREKEKIISHYSFFPRIEGYIYISSLDCVVVCDNDDEVNRFNNTANKEKFTRYKTVKSFDKSIPLISDLMVLDSKTELCNGFNDRLAMVYRRAKENMSDFDIVYMGNTDSESINLIPGKKDVFMNFIISPKGQDKINRGIELISYISSISIDER